jgi:phenylacetate-coenzyme A ligase PaaK-like adenylate-forming protein
MNQESRREILAGKIFSISSSVEFEEVAMEMFLFQAENNMIYSRYLELLGIHPSRISRITDIPCLPVSLFKTHKVVTGGKTAKIVFKSSGTAGSTPAIHYVGDPLVYSTSLFNCFKQFYGDPGNYCILALLPSYLERGDSSLVYMAGQLIEKSSHPRSGFYLDDLDMLARTIKDLERDKEPALLLGVSFALLELAEKYSFSLKSTIVMETGGMKGRRKELTREELHSILKSRLGVDEIHSEYGMTELLSQAYSTHGGKFLTPSWMKIMIRDPYNPFSYLESGKNGGVNVIDLANIDSCAFLETADLGKILSGGYFGILGRFDNSDIRGCNLLAD